MKAIIIIAVLLAATVANAQNRYIRTADAEITLEQAPCQAGGKEATLISRSFQGGAYGCWVQRDGQVIIRWHTLLGANGSILKTDRVSQYPAP